MKPEVTFKYLFYVADKKKKGEKGFTLIELLVVVIIIGILAAVAIPNFLGQVGKARETEGKNAVGTVNRAQQSHHFEKGVWSGPLTNVQLQEINTLTIIIPASKYYTFDIPISANASESAITAIGIDATGTIDNGKAQGIRDYSGMTDFIATAGQYNVIVCQADVSGTVAGVVPISTSSCALNHTEVR